MKKNLGLSFSLGTLLNNWVFIVYIILAAQTFEYLTSFVCNENKFLIGKISTNEVWNLSDSKKKNKKFTF
jgi:hypothetical protein